MKKRNIFFRLLVVAVLFFTACGKTGQTVEPEGVRAEQEASSTPIATSIATPNATSAEIPSATPVSTPVPEAASDEAEIDLTAYFNGMTGTAVFMDATGHYTIYDKAESEQRRSPCSTFKIVSTLAAFEYGVATPEDSEIAWDGTRWKIEAWNRDLNIEEALKSSCVWYYRKLIDKIGQEDMGKFIDMLGYGNDDISQWEGSGFNGSPLIDGFWLESSLLISPREQVDLLYRIFEGKTEIDSSNISEVRRMMLKEENGNVRIYGKTGSGKGGWFVGFYVVDGSNNYFAVYLNEQEGVNGLRAQEIAYNMIKARGETATE